MELTPELREKKRLMIEKKRLMIDGLKKTYKVQYDAVQPIPYIKDRLYCVDKVFVEGGVEVFLAPELTRDTGESWERLESYKSIYTDPRFNSKRRIIQGEPGYGKSTLTLQLAYDWCNDVWNSSMRNVEILILLRLRQIGGIESIYRAIKIFLLAYEPRVTVEDIKEIIQSCSSVNIILDGYDEYPDRESNSNNDVDKMIVMELFPKVDVTVTTRYLPKRLKRRTKRAKLTGFDDKARHEYIRKAVVGDRDKDVEQIKRRLYENSVLADICQVPLIFVMFAHMADDLKHVMKFTSVTQFFKYMVGCFHEHLKQKPDGISSKYFDIYETEHHELDKIAFEGLNMQNQQLSWKKEKFQESVSQALYEQYILIGILVEEQVVSGISVEGYVLYTTEVRFYHKLFCEWYAAHYFVSFVMTESYLKNALRFLDPFDLQYLYRFACGLHPDAGKKLIDHLKILPGGDTFAILCILEQTGDVNDIMDSIKELCSRDVKIQKGDSALLQRSTTQLLEIASNNNIPITGIHLDCSSIKIKDDTVFLHSGISLPKLPTVEMIHIASSYTKYNNPETLAEKDIVNLFHYGMKSTRIKELMFEKLQLPTSLPVLTEIMKTRNIQVRWRPFDMDFHWDPKIADWEVDTIDSLRQLCSDTIYINDSDAILKQRSTIQIIHIASKYDIPISSLNLESSFGKIDDGCIILTSGLKLSCPLSLKKIIIHTEEKREMTETEFVDLLNFVQHSHKLEELRLDDWFMPVSFSHSSFSKTKISRNIYVSWCPFDDVFYLNLQTGFWEVDNIDSLQQLCSDTINIEKSDGISKQRSTIQLTQIASNHDIPISSLCLERSFGKIDSDSGCIILTSGLNLSCPVSLKKLTIHTEDKREMTETEFIDLQNFVQHSHMLKELRLDGCFMPVSFSHSSFSKTKISRNFYVSWCPFDDVFYLNLQTGFWEVDTIESLRQLCSDTIYINGSDDILKQRSTVQIIHIASNHDIPIICLHLQNSFSKIDAGNVILHSGLRLSCPVSVIQVVICTKEEKEMSDTDASEEEHETTETYDTQEDNETTELGDTEEDEETAEVTEEERKTTQIKVIEIESETQETKVTEEKSETTETGNTEEERETTDTEDTERQREITQTNATGKESETKEKNVTVEESETTETTVTEGKREISGTEVTENERETTETKVKKEEKVTTETDITEREREITETKVTEVEREMFETDVTERESEIKEMKGTEEDAERTQVKVIEIGSETKETKVTEEKSETTETGNTEEESETTDTEDTERQREITQTNATDKESETKETNVTVEESETTETTVTEGKREISGTEVTENESETTETKVKEEENVTTETEVTEREREITETKVQDVEREKFKTNVTVKESEMKEINGTEEERETTETEFTEEERGISGTEVKEVTDEESETTEIKVKEEENVTTETDVTERERELTETKVTEVEREMFETGVTVKESEIKEMKGTEEDEETTQTNVTVKESEMREINGTVEESEIKEIEGTGEERETTETKFTEEERGISGTEVTDEESETTETNATEKEKERTKTEVTEREREITKTNIIEEGHEARETKVTEEERETSETEGSEEESEMKDTDDTKKDSKMTETEFVDILTFVQTSHLLKELRFEGGLMPGCFSPSSFMKTISSRNIHVSWCPFNDVFRLDLQTGQWEVDNIDSLPQLCSDTIYINDSDDILKQRSTIQLIQIATNHDIPISCLYLRESFKKIDSGKVILHSGLYLPCPVTVEKVVINTERKLSPGKYRQPMREMTKKKVVDILMFVQRSHILKEIRFDGCILPVSFSTSSVTKTIISRNIIVSWCPFNDIFRLNLQTGQWEVDNIDSLRQLCSDTITIDKFDKYMESLEDLDEDDVKAKMFQVFVNRLSRNGSLTQRSTIEFSNIVSIQNVDAMYSELGEKCLSDGILKQRSTIQLMHIASNHNIPISCLCVERSLHYIGDGRLFLQAGLFLPCPSSVKRVVIKEQKPVQMTEREVVDILMFVKQSHTLEELEFSGYLLPLTFSLRSIFEEMQSRNIKVFWKDYGYSLNLQSCAWEVDEVDVVRNLCTKDVYIREKDVQLLQECTIRLLENASNYDIPISCLHLRNCVRYIDANNIYLQSKLRLSCPLTVKKVIMKMDKVKVSKTEFVNILMFVQQSHLLEGLEFTKCLFPRTVPAKSVPSILKWRNVKVSWWVDYNRKFTLNLQSGRWMDISSGLEMTYTEYDNTRQMLSKSEGGNSARCPLL